MKIKLRSFLKSLVGLALFAVVSGADAEVIAPSSTNQSDCKGMAHAYGDDGEGMGSTVSYDNGILTVSVTDFLENCAAELVVTCNADIPGEIHFIIENEVGPLANCYCPFDVECTYEGVLEGHYKIFLEAPCGHIYLETEADIESGCRISFGNPSGIGLIGTPGSLSLVAGNILKIDAANSGVLTIYDAAGRIRGKLTVAGASEISLSTLPKGIYLLDAVIDGKTERVKLIL